MSDIMSFSPLWGEWYIKGLIGKGTFGAVYQAEKNEYGNRYFSAIKHLSIPPENVTKETLIEDGIATDDRTLSLYCDRLRDQIIKEINFCYKLRGNTNIVSYEDHCIIPKKNGMGYDIFIRMELLTGLTKYLSVHPMNEKDVVKLGIELCEALNVLDMNQMIHRDIKPANIFVNSLGVFKLGDFGESKVLSNSSIGMTVRGTYAYMSPEISKGESANITADIYSLGLVMYRLLNGNRAPFLPVTSQPVDSSATESANVRRLKGEPFPPPAYCRDHALASIIMKACAFNRQDRWQSPSEMKRALEAIRNGVAPNDTPTIAPTFPVQYNNNTMFQNQQPLNSVHPSQNPSFQNPSFQNQTLHAQSVQPQSVHSQPVQSQYMPAPQHNIQPPPQKNSKSLLIGILIGAAIAIVVAIVLIIVLNSGSKNNDQSESESSSQENTSVSVTESAEPSIEASTEPSVEPSAEPSVESSAEPSYQYSREESSSLITSRVESSVPQTSSASQSLREFLESPEGIVFAAAAESSGKKEENVLDCKVYAEGEDNMVIDVTYNISGLTDDEIALVATALQSDKPTLQESVGPSMKQLQTQCSINDFNLIYRYRTADGKHITDLVITVN